MILKGLCPPALIYLIFSLSQIIIDTAKGYFNTALIKVFTTIIFTLLLNFLCSSGLGIISWIIVFIPFILMTIITVLLLGLLGLHPKQGRMSDHKKEEVPLIQNGPITSNNENVETSYGVDEKKKEEEEEIDYDKITIQNDKKGSDGDYKWFTRLYYNENKFGRRKEYVKIIRNILIDMNEGNEAAMFMNQSETCINRDSNEEFESCLKILCFDVSEKLGGGKKRTFLKNLKSRNII